MTRFILADSASAASDKELADVLKNAGSERIGRKLSQILSLAKKFDILY